MAVIELVDHLVLDRKRKPKDVSADATANAEKSDAKPTDPFGKFRKLFNPKSKIKGAASGSAGHIPKGGAGRKTPAAGGGFALRGPRWGLKKSVCITYPSLSF